VIESDQRQISEVFRGVQLVYFAGLAVFALRLAVLLVADVVAIATKDERR